MKNLINKSVFLFICSLILIKNVNAANDIDANWMTYIPDSKYLYEINIPGTHDSGTYDIGQFSNSKILNKIASRSGLNAINAAKSEFGRTQDLDIKEQLEHGIRYLDIRISTTDNEENIFYLSHGNNLPVIDTVSCIDLNSKNDEEDFDKYFYDGNTFPKLGEVRGKIILVTRNEYLHKKHGKPEGYGIHLRIGGMGGCRDYPDDGKVCYPIYYNTSNANIKYVIQDAYNLDGPDKWDLVKNTITKFVSFRDEKENIIKGSKYTDLTLNFMNMARMEFNKDSFEGVVNSAVVDGLKRLLTLLIRLLVGSLKKMKNQIIKEVVFNVIAIPIKYPFFLNVLKIQRISGILIPMVNTTILFQHTIINA
eukprot:jgi/Orpsp1_1/1178174/evm.model.c7180000064326.1